MCSIASTLRFPSYTWGNVDSLISSLAFFEDCHFLTSHCVPNILERYIEVFINNNGF